ncbi:MAG: hypothetical protein JXQ75_15560 [Phycisphaerae bacterium]|nr:hypothetical protein [Phycisphaerae bacterium]
MLTTRRSETADYAARPTCPDGGQPAHPRGNLRPKRHYSRRAITVMFVMAGTMVLIGGTFWAIGANELRAARRHDDHGSRSAGATARSAARTGQNPSDALAHSVSLLDAQDRAVDRMYYGRTKRRNGMLATLAGAASVIWLLVIVRRQRSADLAHSNASGRTPAPA